MTLSTQITASFFSIFEKRSPFSPMIGGALAAILVLSLTYLISPVIDEACDAKITPVKKRTILTPLFLTFFLSTIITLYSALQLFIQKKSTENFLQLLAGAFGSVVASVLLYTLVDPSLDQGTIIPLSKVRSAELNRLISPMTADFPSLKERCFTLHQKVLGCERLKSRNPLAPDLQQLFFNIIKALSPSNMDDKGSSERRAWVISILKILSTPQADKHEKLRRIKEKMALTAAEITVIQKAIEDMSVASYTCLMNLLIFDKAGEVFPFIDSSLIEAFTDACCSITFVSKQDSASIENILFLVKQIQELEKDLQTFSERYNWIFNEHGEELQQGFPLKRTKEMTPEIRKQMEKDLDALKEKLLTFIMPP